ncbi:MAG: xanthine dehydrogenase family protein molybdopterin-binding subunit [Acidimicrobiia bacterium]
MTRTVLGHSVLRSEDPGLLTGSARFMADLEIEDTLHAVFVRSHVAHGTVEAVHTAEAAACTGVHSVWTAADLDLPGKRASGEEGLERPLLAVDRVRFVGEAVAVVLAGTLAHALDAADEVVVEIEPLPAVADPIAAAADGAPLLFPEHGTNLMGATADGPDHEFFADAHVVARVRVAHQRVAPVTMEANGCVAVPEPDGSLTVWASTQSVFGVQREVARTLGLDAPQVRVRAPWIGGGFGAKGGVYPEQLVVAGLAHKVGRTVRWTESRRENLLGMTHGRGQVHDVELGATRDGRFTGLRVRGFADVGAYATRGMFIPTITRMMSSGVYAIPKIDFEVTPVVTNCTPTGFYRGAGRPEAASLVERAVDAMARELGSDPVELRRRNFPPGSAFPFTTATGTTYDSGEYEAALDEALRLADYDALREEQRRRREDPDAVLLGIGIACYVETSGRGSEFGSVEVHADGTVTVVTGSVPHGQGHETTWAQIASATLGVPFEVVRVVHSDTALVDHGVGTFGSRSAQLAGSAVREAAEVVLERARALAAEMLEASPDDVVVLDDGRLGVVGVPASGLTWAEIATEATRRATPLSHELDFDSLGSFPFGCHVATVEIDRETGGVTLRELVAVDDCGVVINPLLAEGQVHGGLAQGIAQILYEGVRYDDDANPLTASLLDYLVPAASDLPSFRTAHTVTPSPNNPLGAKGIGESGTTGSIAAVWNAVLDALAPFGVTNIDPPCTPELVWRAMHDTPG